MLTFSRGWLYRTLVPGLALMIMVASFSSPAGADDCKRISNILVLFDASGFMKDKWQFFMQQMAFFQQAMPITADGFFNVGIRHYGLKVGLGCENTESILAIQPWDPERFLNAFPRYISYGVSSLSAGLRAAGDEAASAAGKTIIVLIGGGIESCNIDPVKVTDQMCRNNPDLEIHTFQIGQAPEGNFYLRKSRPLFIMGQKSGKAKDESSFFESSEPHPSAGRMLLYGAVYRRNQSYLSPNPGD